MLQSSCSPGALPKRARRCWCWPPCSLSNMRSSETPRGLRIVGGVHRGRRLVAPPGEAVRPTSDRAREALFNILSHGRFAAAGLPFADRPVLDAFAGTGALGLEDRKSTRLNSSHTVISYAVFCLKKKTK